MEWEFAGGETETLNENLPSVCDFVHPDPS
jgi:hypothetical protein